MTVIIDIDHEAGNLSEYTTTVTDGGDLSASASAALAGTSFGLAVLIDDTNDLYGQYQLGADDTSGVVRVRFYIDPNSLAMNNNTNHFICAMQSSVGNIFTMALVRAGSSYNLRCSLVLDDGSSAGTTTANYTITDAPHYVEFEVVRAANSTSADGEASLWIDGAFKETVTGDNFDRFANFRLIRIGATSGVDATTSGTYYIDQIKANNDGSQIGEHSSAVTGNSSITEGADTLSGTGAAAVFGVSAVTESADALNGAGTSAVDGDSSIGESADTLDGSGAVVSPGVTGTASITEAADTLSASGTVSVIGAASISESADGLSAAGLAAVTGTASIPETGDSLAASGVAAVAGTAGVSESTDVLSASGAIAVAGAAAVTEGADTLSGAGIVGSLPVDGNASISESGDTLSASGAVSVSGLAGTLENADTLASSGAASISGAALITEAADTLSASGVVFVDGTGTVTENADSLVSIGGVSITGTASVDETGDTLSAAGSTGYAPAVGAALISESADTLSVSGMVAVYASATLTDTDNLSAAGTASITGQANINEGADILLGISPPAHLPTAWALHPRRGELDTDNEPGIRPARGAVAAAPTKKIIASRR